MAAGNATRAQTPKLRPGRQAAAFRLSRWCPTPTAAHRGLAEFASTWGALVAAAARKVERAMSGDPGASLELVTRDALALRSLLDRDALPSPQDKVYLYSLLESLADITKGSNATDALHLKRPSHRPLEDLEVDRLMLFLQVGEALDRLVAMGQTRGVRVVDTAIGEVAKRSKLTMDSVQKAWSLHGSRAGWKAYKTEQQ